jgi:chemotaxis protein methyltransferase CheR
MSAALQFTPVLDAVLASTDDLKGPILSGEVFAELSQRVFAASGIVLREGKEQLVQSRIGRRLRALGLESFEEYVARLDRDPEEQTHFVSAITTNLTAFFRELHHFEILAAELRARRLGSEPIRVWSSACSSGEEPYSAAMVLEEAGAAGRILATDIDEEVLASASSGVYRLDRLEGLSVERRRHFLDRGTGEREGLARVKATLRQRVEFKQLNLVERWSLRAPFDVIFCRNVLIYFDPPTQSEVVRRLIGSLKVGGLLFLGHAEVPPEQERRLALVGHTAFRRVS